MERWSPNERLLGAYQDSFRGCCSTSQGEFVGRRREKKNSRGAVGA